MPPSIRKHWAKETLMCAIDKEINDFYESQPNADLDEEDSLVLQRNRIAKLLNFPIKTWWEIILNQEC